MGESQLHSLRGRVFILALKKKGEGKERKLSVILVQQVRTPCEEALVRHVWKSLRS